MPLFKNILTNLSTEADRNLTHRLDLLRLEGLEAGSYLGGRIITGIVLSLLLGLFMMFVSLAVAVLLGQFLGGLLYGLLSVGGFFGLLIPLLWFNRHRLFMRPVRQWLSQKLRFTHTIRTRAQVQVSEARLKAALEASNRSLQSQFAYLQDSLKPEQIGLELIDFVKSET